MKVLLKSSGLSKNKSKSETNITLRLHMPQITKPHENDAACGERENKAIFHRETTTFLADTPFLFMSMASWTYSRPLPTTSGSGAAMYLPWARAAGK